MIKHRTKEDELEESQLREELKAIDAALKKNKKVLTDRYFLDSIQWSNSSFLYIFFKPGKSVTTIGSGGSDCYHNC